MSEIDAEEYTRRYALTILFSAPITDVSNGRKTRYIKINNAPLNYTNALSYGKYVIDKSPLASFKIVMTNKPIKQRFNLYTVPYKFRATKTLPKGIIIEKRRYRIDSKGEKQGITLKGLTKLRKQNMIKRFFR